MFSSERFDPVTLFDALLGCDVAQAAGAVSCEPLPRFRFSWYGACNLKDVSESNKQRKERNSFKSISKAGLHS